ncbi:MAG: PIG-L family deacetylase [Anaerolineales bacterium]|nr:MAG: PIG-L family deacetylase [Anaerolineales bacterium]
MSNNFPDPKNVLVICAHPDDPDFGVAGTVAKWTSQGAKVTYVVVTDGSKGSPEPKMTKEKLIKLREEEQRKAADILGVDEVVFLGQPDGELRNTFELQEMLVRLIRTYKPDVLVTHDPTARIVDNVYLNHNDHRVVGDAVLDSVFPLARDRLNFPEHEKEGLEPHKVLDIFLLFTNEPNYWVDITNTIDKKIAALKAHKSQIGDPDELEERIRDRARLRAKKVSFEYAEIFRRVRLQR